MKVFISWSGERSRSVAEALRDWIPKVIQAVKPWISSRDIPKGARWSQHISAQLEDAQVGIICLTQENLNAEWILFEAGALAKTLDESLVCTFLLGVKPTDVREPLSQFQATKGHSKEDIRMMLQSINMALNKDSALSEKHFESIFDKWWPDLEKVLNKIPKFPSKLLTRSVDDMVEEVLELIRGLVRANRLATDPRAVQLLKEIEIEHQENNKRMLETMQLEMEQIAKRLKKDRAELQRRRRKLRISIKDGRLMIRPKSAK